MQTRCCQVLHVLTTTRPKPPCSCGKESSTSGDDQSRRRLLGENGHPTQLEVKQLAQALGQVERAALRKLEKQNTVALILHPALARALAPPSASLSA